MWRVYRSSVRLKPPDGVRFLSDHVRRLPPVFSNTRRTELVYRLTRHWKAEKIVPSTEYLSPLLERWGRAKKTRHILTVMRYMDLVGALFSPALYLNLIRAHCECGEIVKGLYYYHEMCFTGIKPSAEIFKYLFRVLGENQKFAEAKWLWEDVKAKGLSLDRELYASFAYVLFVERGFSAITKLLNSSAGESNFDEGDFMNSLIAVLNEKSEVQMAEMLLKELADRDLRPDSKALASFVDAYMRDGKTHEAREILRAQEENSILGIESYNGLMRGLLTTGQCERLKEVFETIEAVEDVVADRESFMLLLSALSSIDDHTGLMRAFEKFKSREFEVCDEVADRIIHSQIVAGKVKQAAKLFLDEFAAQRCSVFRATQASLIEGLVSMGEHSLAVDVFENLQALGEDRFTQVTNAQMVEAYYNRGDSLSAGHLMSVIVETTVPSRDWPKLSCRSRNSILRAQNYVNPEGTKKLYSAFKQLGCSVNETTHAIVIDSFGKTRNMRSLEDVLQKMRSGRLKYSEITAEAMADAFVEMGEVTKALSVLEEAAGDGLKPQLKSYSRVILYFARNDVGSMYRAIQNLCAKGVPPSLEVFEIAIRSLANRGHDSSAHGVYKMVKDAGATPNREILEDLVSMCARLGKVQDALFYFDELIAHDIVPSSRSLNWILNGLARGLHIEVLGMFYNAMKRGGVAPDGTSRRAILLGFAESPSFCRGVSELNAILETQDIQGELAREETVERGEEASTIEEIKDDAVKDAEEEQYVPRKIRALAGLLGSFQVKKPFAETSVLQRQRRLSLERNFNPERFEDVEHEPGVGDLNYSGNFSTMTPESWAGVRLSTGEKIELREKPILKRTTKKSHDA
ncbi:hypothetical protein NDN08_001386 [Rhodosorus marinus]|uniref:Pentatricopeptide repeat-containing protein-mitochondrial domain-containing protein n=1 Tax=Rhodosorus marinus TaxID=101924 RepID=A0AAV8UUT7_9RHOD|nr:hypothetical protein NDN08_001386 [Rhodosorus marinus]